jgi:mono/diheme cytochrome c family protein
MTRLQIRVLLAGMMILSGAPAAAQTVPKPDASRGELLYATHCTGCHTSQVHWRDKKLATYWTSLKAQVRRWQSNTGLGWSEEEIVDVTRHLNVLYYHFQPPGSQAQAAPGTMVSARDN